MKRRSFPSWRMGRDEISLLGELVQLLVKSSLDEEDLEMIMEGRPWIFQRQLIIFDRLTNPIERGKVRLVLSPFWLKIGQCPPECDKKDLMHAIEYSIFRGVIRLEVKGEFCSLRV
ncbi:hypothetical protein Gotur_007204 [Gossypium turneri]